MAGILSNGPNLAIKQTIHFSWVAPRANVVAHGRAALSASGVAVGSVVISAMIGIIKIASQPIVQIINIL